MMSSTQRPEKASQQQFIEMTGHDMAERIRSAVSRMLMAGWELFCESVYVGAACHP